MTLVVVTLRPARPEEASDVAEVWRAAWHDGHRGHVPDALVEARDTEYFQTRASREYGVGSQIHSQDDLSEDVES